MNIEYRIYAHNLLHFTFAKYIYKTVIILQCIFSYYNLHIYI